MESQCMVAQQDLLHISAVSEIEMFECPVCLYAEMPYPPSDYNICPCCGTEFGLDDEFHTHAELRTRWVAEGAKWFLLEAPAGWNPWSQLIREEVCLEKDLCSLTFQTSDVTVAATPSASTSFVIEEALVWGSLKEMEVKPTSYAARWSVQSVLAGHEHALTAHPLNFGYEYIEVTGQYSRPNVGSYVLVSQKPAGYSAEPFNCLLHVVDGVSHKSFPFRILETRSPQSDGNDTEEYTYNKELAFAS